MRAQLGTGLPRTAGVARPPLVAALPGTRARSGEAKAKAKVAGAGRPRLQTVASRQKRETKVSQRERISELGAQHVAERCPGGAAVPKPPPVSSGGRPEACSANRRIPTRHPLRALLLPVPLASR